MDFSIDVAEIAQDISCMDVACLPATPTAWDREKIVRSAGLRTLPLVAVAWSRFKIVLLLSRMNSFTLWLLGRAKGIARGKGEDQGSPPGEE